MQSEKKSAAKVILAKSPKVAATHHCSHYVKLYLSALYKSPEIQNELGIVLGFFPNPPQSVKSCWSKYRLQ